MKSGSKSSKHNPASGRKAGSRGRQPGKGILLVLGLLVLAYPVWKMVQRGLHQDDHAMIRALVTAEETSLVLNPKLEVLAKAMLEGALPGEGTHAAGIFASPATVIDLGPAPEMTVSQPPTLESRSWPVSSSAQEVGQVDLWRPLLDAVASFEYTDLSLADGYHPEGDPGRFEATGRFEGLARMKTGPWCSMLGRLRLSWVRTISSEGKAGEWQISRWSTEELFWTASPKLLFVEALDKVLRPPQQPETFRRSQHYEATVGFYRSGMQKMPHPYFASISANQKEGLAVVDVNGDGWDDLYITVRLGKNMLLVNQGDGTFVEDAARYKLDLPGHTTCALFADFDNDGDQDVILGRSLLRTSYLENREGVFYQPPIPKYMPMAVISMAAADYNMDGLLDVYLCTYRPAAPMSASPAGGVARGEESDFDWPDEFFDPELAREYRVRVAEYTQRKGGTVLDQLGPPNVLLVNRGGGQFEPAPENPSVGLWRNTLQATWGDYDEDGDPDLFIANDWAPSSLFRNDRAAGFKDVSLEAGITAYGFSMGASWGDYDNDGLEDVYVSNMYSEPGRRLTTRIPGISQMFLESAMGNWLHHQVAPGKFQQVAGMEPPAMTVMDAGWSWGGCFVDFDNDAYLDLYVLSGYFTAPKELDSGLDLESNLWRTMVRTDEQMARPSFRFSPEWKRTGPPDNLGPQIDGRLSGMEREGPNIRVHSLNGGERNHYFANRNGRAFTDVSGVSGLDNVADSRGFAVLDYDRDGWQDVALVNANQPLFNLYHNQMPDVGFSGGLIALRFVGGNRTPSPSREYTGRDGFGARVKVDLGEFQLVREHRCGDGWSTQNSSVMIVGIGAKTTAASVTVRWPSGQTVTTRDVPEGTLLTVFENTAEGPNGEPFARATYRASTSRAQ